MSASARGLYKRAKRGPVRQFVADREYVKKTKSTDPCKLAPQAIQSNLYASRKYLHGVFLGYVVVDEDETILGVGLCEKDAWDEALMCLRARQAIDKNCNGLQKEVSDGRAKTVERQSHAVQR